MRCSTGLWGVWGPRWSTSASLGKRDGGVAHERLQARCHADAAHRSRADAPEPAASGRFYKLLFQVRDSCSSSHAATRFRARGPRRIWHARCSCQARVESQARSAIPRIARPRRHGASPGRGWRAEARENIRSRASLAFWSRAPSRWGRAGSAAFSCALAAARRLLHSVAWRLAATPGRPRGSQPRSPFLPSGSPSSAARGCSAHPDRKRPPLAARRSRARRWSRTAMRTRPARATTCGS